MSQENTTVFFIIMWQIPSVVVLCNRNVPFRRKVWTNWQFDVYFALIVAVQLSMFLDVELWTSSIAKMFYEDFLGIVHLPRSFRLLLFFLSVANITLAALFEIHVLGHIREKETQWEFAQSVVGATPYPEHPNMRVTLLT